MKKFSEAMKDNYTTMIGAILMFLAVGLYASSILLDFEMEWYKAAAMLLMGWVFLMAKDKYFEQLLSLITKK